MKTSGRRIDDLILRFPSAMKVAFGENPKVNYAGMNTSPVTRMAIAGMLREELVNARQYLEKRDQDNADQNLHYEAWRPVFEKKIPLKAHVHRVDDIFTAIRIAKEFDLNMTLDHCSEGHLIAEEILESGFPAMEDGFRAMTINAARICGVSDRIGSIEPGKDADIAVFDGNPMEVFTNTLMTIIDGKIVYRREEADQSL